MTFCLLASALLTYYLTECVQGVAVEFHGEYFKDRERLYHSGKTYKSERNISFQHAAFASPQTWNPSTFVSMMSSSSHLVATRRDETSLPLRFCPLKMHVTSSRKHSPQEAWKIMKNWFVGGGEKKY
ncbi:hypothetical protein XU18_3674 [Perkinsela sp. CCAP 1560/4]|nr:hypothetical protein XU18_3674 [Perkinsela sp. CCAP 1560/4]|eukprot:KNH05270.1 hypothetical protein XU18_3674 [Perkinsela sp. CCAP 1560/4]